MMPSVAIYVNRAGVSGMTANSLLSMIKLVT
jgi:hypothetical protein